MKGLNLALSGLLCGLLVAVPAGAEAHGGLGAGAFLGLGLGLLTGLALESAPVYVPPPVYLSVAPCQLSLRPALLRVGGFSPSRSLW